MANFSPLAAEIGSGVWGTLANFNGFCFASCLRYCSDVAHRRPTKLCTMFGRLLRCYTICTFSGAVAPCQNFATCKIHFVFKSCVRLYWQRYYQTLRRGTRNGIAELSQRAPPIFGWAAITLGIGPHSSSDLAVSTF